MKRLNLKAFLPIALALSFNLTGCSSVDRSSIHYAPDDQVVVIAHGLGRSDWAMWRLAKKMESAGYQPCLLDYSTIGQNIEQVMKDTSEQINVCVNNAPRVHFVGHSLGGLVIRSYLEQNIDQLPASMVGEVVLMGTPNKGSELADHLKDSWLMRMGGTIARALTTGDESLGRRLSELNLNIGIIAGTKSSSLTGRHFSGPNDGLVSVDSTKLASMSDFIEINVGHSEMRSSDEVAAQTIHFLKRGVFKH